MTHTTETKTAKRCSVCDRREGGTFRLFARRGWLLCEVCYLLELEGDCEVQEVALARWEALPYVREMVAEVGSMGGLGARRLSHYRHQARPLEAAAVLASVAYWVPRETRVDFVANAYDFLSQASREEFERRTR